MDPKDPETDPLAELVVSSDNRFCQRGDLGNSRHARLVGVRYRRWPDAVRVLTIGSSLSACAIDAAGKGAATTLNDLPHPDYLRDASI
jgi:hypothetical protein